MEKSMPHRRERRGEGRGEEGGRKMKGKAGKEGGGDRKLG